jgi:hypothetical protein
MRAVIRFKRSVAASRLAGGSCVAALMPRGWSCVPLKRRPQRSDCGKAYALFPYGVHRGRAARPANPFEVPESSAISLFSSSGALTADFGTWYVTEKGIFGAYRGAARGALAKMA